MSRCPLADRSLTKAILFPSGDRAGDASSAGWFVTSCTLEPSANIVYTSKSSLRLDSNAICEPSGDQTGSLLTPPAFVSCFLPEPSGATVQIALVVVETFDRVPLVNAICVPSGDHDGATWSPAPVTSECCFVPSEFMT